VDTYIFRSDRGNDFWGARINCPIFQAHPARSSRSAVPSSTPPSAEPAGVEDAEEAPLAAPLLLEPMAGVHGVNLEGPTRFSSGEGGMPDMPPAAIQQKSSENGLSSDGAPPGKPAGKSDYPAIGISATSAEPQKLDSPWNAAPGPHTLPPVFTPAPAEVFRGSASRADAGEAAGISECRSESEERPATVKVEGVAAEVDEGVGMLSEAPGLAAEVAIERLEGLLRRLGAEHDPENFFQERVREEMLGCGNYYDKIKNPMWFSLIRNKVRVLDPQKSHSNSLEAHSSQFLSNFTGAVVFAVIRQVTFTPKTRMFAWKSYNALEKWLS
jgi:hypothetical protein